MGPHDVGQGIILLRRERGSVSIVFIGGRMIMVGTELGSGCSRRDSKSVK